MYEATKKKIVARIRRVAGQLDGGSRSMYRSRPLFGRHRSSARLRAGRPGQAGKLVLRAFVESRLSGVDDATTPGRRKQRIDELMDVFARYAGLARRTHDAG